MIKLDWADKGIITVAMAMGATTVIPKVSYPFTVISLMAIATLFCWGFVAIKVWRVD